MSHATAPPLALWVNRPEATALTDSRSARRPARDRFEIRAPPQPARDPDHRLSHERLRLVDEAIHLASAFQLAGYRHVIATLWPIGDQHAVAVADDIYAALATTGDAAAAVHTAVRELRDRWAAAPSTWASHIHVGP
ncbi:CHAT domain-containing protein [Frankia sp. CNm7]|uniref:CHAT domain-containing protein n=1 Tax=Frankia nepalensis TaxID=1836974 RepID=A0A937R792_9ACTN|nr:CHAT domain-containing protein [Frankia nepalensis]MBL7509233.1 CHAT domain-containing protein [Frankia nepalensis]MBL7517308.1 CHAT domain-containing protein [Frankia nepalensis]MBL7627003.1 CHAT domain-containing protein [Frankia nepalensis]